VKYFSHLLSGFHKLYRTLLKKINSCTQAFLFLIITHKYRKVAPTIRIYMIVTEPKSPGLIFYTERK